MDLSAWDPDLLVSALDLAATGAGALAGGLVAARLRLDVVGLAVLAFVSGVGGGVLRDLFLGATPPVAFRDARYLLIAGVAALAVVLAPRVVVRTTPAMTVLDAIGVGLFAAVGATKAASAGHPVVTIVLVGTLAAVGGGLLRDVLTAQLPTVLHTEVTITAAAAGTVVFVVLARGLDQPLAVAAVACGVVAAGLRGVAIRQGWSAPRAPRISG